MSKYLREPTMADVEYLSKNLRAKDVEELMALGATPLHALTLGFNNSKPCYTLLTPEGAVSGMMGVSGSQYPGLGAIWMLGSPDLERYPLMLVRQSKLLIDQILSETPYDGVFNYAYAKNTLHIDWLRWLGFSLLRRVQMPPFNRDFIEFVKLRG